MKLKAKISQRLEGELPPNFEELVAGRMYYLEEDSGVLVCASDLKEAEEEFRHTEFGQALVNIFNQFPQFEEITLLYK